jgi:hypothetical protein
MEVEVHGTGDIAGFSGDSADGQTLGAISGEHATGGSQDLGALVGV